jgi:hypothetical protein
MIKGWQIQYGFFILLENIIGDIFNFDIFHFLGNYGTHFDSNVFRFITSLSLINQLLQQDTFLYNLDSK